MKKIKRYFVSFWNGVDLRYRLLKGPRIRISIAGIIISRVSSINPILASSINPIFPSSIHLIRNTHRNRIYYVILTTKKKTNDDENEIKPAPLPPS